MNRKQKICLWIGIVAIAVMGIYPPWVLSTGSSYRQGPVKDCGYKWIWSPPDAREEGLSGLYPFAATLDTSRLYVQWAVVAVITGGLIAVFAGEKEKKPKE